MVARSSGRRIHPAPGSTHSSFEVVNSTLSIDGSSDAARLRPNSSRTLTTARGSPGMRNSDALAAPYASSVPW